MMRNISLIIIAGLICMFAPGSGAEDQPEKRVMSSFQYKAFFMGNDVFPSHGQAVK